MEVVTARPRKVVTPKGRSRAALNKVPDEILNDPELKLAMEVLPDNYNLEILKVKHNTYSQIESFDGITSIGENLSKTEKYKGTILIRVFI